MNYDEKKRIGMLASQRAFLEKNGYIMKELVGEGGFGQVYRVWDNKEGRSLACKIASNALGRNVLRQEAKLQKRIKHPIFPCYVDFLESREYTMFLMDYLEGERLDMCLQDGALEQKRALSIAIQLAQGLEYLHNLPEPILYRDLKPANICLAQDGKVYLMDLGCACSISQAQFSKAGSPGYAPREQLGELHGEGDNPKVKQPGFYSDVYGLGKLLHYMLTGDDPCKPPVKKMPIRAYNRKFSPLLEQLVMQCVEEVPKLRPPDVYCVLRILHLLLGERIRDRIAVKKKELQIVMGDRGGREYGFIYERNICCSVQK